MRRRTITLNETAYRRLTAAKRRGESFSDVVRRLAARDEPSLLNLVGALSSEAADDLRRFVNKHRAVQAQICARRRGRTECG